MYKIYFTDGTTFEGGDIGNSKWNEMPDKFIKKLEYTLVKKTLVLENFYAYNHIVERVQFVNKEGAKITKLILMGTDALDKVMKITYDFDKQRVYQKLEILGQEYNGKPTTGWKKGVLGKPKTLVL